MQRKILDISNLNPFENIITINKYEGVFQGLPVPNKETILKYLCQYKPILATSREVFDEVTRQKVKGFYDVGYFDGKYSWDEKDVYLFEKYNMPLKDEFVEHILIQKNNN